MKREKTQADKIWKEEEEEEEKKECEVFTWKGGGNRKVDDS